MQKYRGFTLIELLVVIAIIGILSAVVLTSLSTARSKGSDAAIQSDLSTIQTQAEIYYGSNGNSYGTANNLCTPSTNMFGDPTIAKAITGATTASAGLSANVLCGNTTTAYAVQVRLNAATPASTFWCIDSGGTAKAEPSGSGFSAGTAACP